MSGMPMELVERTRSSVVRNKCLIAGALAVALLVMAVGANILLTPGTIMYGDFNTPREMDRFELYPMWTPFGHYTNTDKADRLLGFGVTVSLAIALGLPTEAFIKMMVLGTLLMAGLSSYLASFWIGRRKFSRASERAVCVAAFTVSVIYMLSPWSMNRIEHFFLWTGYALAPLILVGAMKGLEDHDVKTLALTGFLWTVASTSAHYTIFLFMLVLGALIYQNPLRARWPQRIGLLRSFLILLTTFLVTSMYWIAPYIASLLEGVSGPPAVLTVEVVNMLSASSGPLNAFRGIGYWWPRTDMALQGELGVAWGVASYIVPVMAFSALLFRRDRLTLSLTAMALIFFVLSMGTNWGLGGAYSWLTFDAPLSRQIGWLLRDPDKWAGPMWLTYCLLIMVTLLELNSRSRLKFGGWSDGRNKTAAMFLTCIILLSGFMVFAVPSVNGHMNGIYVPMEVPGEYYSTNDWLAGLDGDFNVLWLPNTLGTSTNWTSNMVSNIENMYSGKPDIGGTTVYGAYYRSFLSQTLAENRTDHFGKLLATAGIKYLIVREDVPELHSLIDAMESSLSWQKDMALVRQDGALKVYEVIEDVKLVYATDNIISVIGGLSSLRSLACIEGFNMTSAGVLFPQEAPGLGLIGGKLLISGAGQEDLVLLDRKGIVVAPYSSTDHHDPAGRWSKASTLDPLHGTWRAYLEEMGISGWYFDYGQGLVLTWVNGTEPGSELGTRVNVPDAGSYYISVRYLQNIRGGPMKLVLDDDELISLDSLSEVNGFVWDTVGPVNLGPGEHAISFINEGGFNAVNIVLVTERSQWERSVDDANDRLSRSEVVYLMEAEESMTAVNDQMVIASAGSYGQGQGVVVSGGNAIAGTLNILSTGDYRIGIAAAGELEIVIDGVATQVNGMFPEMSYLGPMPLTNGTHSVSVKNKGPSEAVIDSIWFFSGSASSLDTLFNGDRSAAEAVSYGIPDATTRTADLRGDGVVLLITGTVYDERWTARMHEWDIASVPTWGFLNGFVLNVPGNASVTVEYRPQAWLYASGGFSIVGTVVLVTALTVHGWRLRKLRT